jgi:predicted Zn-dependent protease
MLGFYIRNGEWAGRVTDTMISGNVYDAFCQVRSMGAEVREVGSDYVPDVCFANLAVSGH